MYETSSKGIFSLGVVWRVPLDPSIVPFVVMTLVCMNLELCSLNRWRVLITMKSETWDSNPTVFGGFKFSCR